MTDYTIVVPLAERASAYTLSWTAPTTRANGDALSGDITGYKVYKDTGSGFSRLGTTTGTSYGLSLADGDRVAVATTWSTGQSPLSDTAAIETTPTATHNVSSSDDLPTIQGVINSLSPGDVLEFADGTYSNTSNTPLDFGATGTEANPITIRGASNTGVILQGAGFSVPETGAQIAVIVTGSWLNISNFVTEDYSTGKFWAAWRVYADDTNITECRFHDNYGGGLFIGADNAASNVIVRNCLCRNSGAFTGLAFRHTGSATVADTVDGCWFIDCVSYNNGYSDDGVALFGDSPGNADCLGVSKEFDDSSITISNSGFQRNVSWRGADDIYDFNFTGSGGKMVNNVLFNPGTEGTRLVKNLRYASAPLDMSGNILFDNQNTGTTGIGFEARYGAGSDGYFFLNNSIVDTTGNGYSIFYSGLTDTSASKIQNNMVYQTNGTVDQSTNATVSNNHTTGDPEIVDWTKLDQTDFNLTFTGMTVKQIHRHVFDQAWKWGMPDTTSSPLYEGGVLNASVHCATADDNATTPADPEELDMVHWTGSVPQIGAVPYRFIDPPTDVSIS